MVYGPGGTCDGGDNNDTTCDRCFPSKSKSPIVVKICRPIIPNQMHNGRRLPSKGGDCCQWCNNKANLNQMVSNQNQIVNFDLINRIKDAAQPYGFNSNLTYTSGATGKRKCDNCINILRDKELQLLKKEQEILKIKTHFTKVPKHGGQDGLGTNCEHCFKALRQKEFELFRKEQEIGKMKMEAAAKSPLDTKAKIDKARCANCFKALRQKELELIKKEHALMKNLTRPNINVKNLNYCSCCRDNNKSSINKLKKEEDMRKKNRDNCFKQLRMKEIQLLQKEKEIYMKIKKFREESIAKAKKDLENTPDPRQIDTKTRDVVKCVCSCTGSPEHKEEKKKAKGLCRVIFKKFPRATGGWPEPKQKKSKDTVKSIKALLPQTCGGPCCAMKLATDLAACFLRPPKCKKPKELPEPCKFMRMLTWCSPGHVDSKKNLKCCTLMPEPEIKLIPKEQIKFNKRIVEEKLQALKDAKAETDAVSEYRVETLGRIRPGKRRPSPQAKLDAYEAEVLRTSGPKGLKAYKTRMKLLQIDTEVAKTKIPKTMEFKDKDLETQVPKEFGTQQYDTQKYGAKQYGNQQYGTQQYSTQQYSTKETMPFLSKVGVRGKRLKSRDLYSGTNVGRETGADRETTVPSSKFITKKATFKTKVYDRATRAAKKMKAGADYKDSRVFQKYKPKGAYSETKVSRKDRAKAKTMLKDERIKEIRKSRTTFDDDGPAQVPRKYRTGVQAMKEDRKYRAKVDAGRYKAPKSYKNKGAYEKELPKRYRTTYYQREVEDDYDYGAPRRSTGLYGSGDYADEWGGSSEKMRGPSAWYSSPGGEGCPKVFKILGRSIVYCAGCFIGIPCILFLCLCFLLSSCSD